MQQTAAGTADSGDFDRVRDRRADCTAKKVLCGLHKRRSRNFGFLNVVEAHVALMEFENSRIVREVRNTVNRRVNCETANITKTVTAAARQVDDILFLQQNMDLKNCR